MLTFPVRRLAVRIGYVAQPDERKVHQRVTPEAGGVAMFVALLVALAVAASIPALDPLFQGSSRAPRPGPRGRGHLRGGAHRRPPGHVGPGQDGRPGPGGLILYFLGVTWFQFKVPLAGFVVLSPE